MFAQRMLCRLAEDGSALCARRHRTAFRFKCLDQALPTELAGFDLKEALARLSGNEKLLRKLFGSFARANEQAGEQLADLLKARQFGPARELVHGIKGAAGNLSATALYEGARALENSLKQGLAGDESSEHDTDALYGRFCEALEAALETMRALSQAVVAHTDAPTRSEALDPALAGELAAKIREGAEGGDLDVLGSLVKELAAVSPRASEMQECVDNFDFDGLLEFADRLEER